MSAVVSVISDNYLNNVTPCAELTNKIKGAMYDVAKSFVYIGFLLAECDYFGSYKEWGYSSIYEYSSVNLGFKKSSVNNFINICRNFSSNTGAMGEQLPFSMIMKDTYASYNYSQLVEMLSMNEKQRSQVTPDMTIKEIRQLKKNDSFQTSGNCDLNDVIPDTFQTSGMIDVASAPVESSELLSSFCLHDVSDIEFVDMFTVFDEEYLSSDDFMNFGEFLLFKFKELGYCLKKIDS